MKRTSILAAASVVSLLAVGLVSSPAYAWHPKGEINKAVQNQTVAGTISDANDITTAVSAAPGDTLVYTIVVKNSAEPAADGNNDMAGTTLIDRLPDGIELVSDPAKRMITEDLGTIKPGESVTKTYAVKVTSKLDGATITNKACFAGDSAVHDNAQRGCDVAIVTVKVPPTPPVPPTTPPLPPKLPDTGSASTAGALAVLGGLVAGYIVNTVRLARQRRG